MTLDLNCANFYDENRGILTFPPKGAKQYSAKVNRKSVKATIKELGDNEKLVLKAYNNKTEKETNKEDDQMTH